MVATTAGVAQAATVDPASAAVGATIVVTGAPGDVESRPGSYRVIVADSREAPVLEVVALGGQTSAALLVFGVLFLAALLVGGVAVHRRWRDATS